MNFDGNRPGGRAWPRKHGGRRYSGSARRLRPCPGFERSCVNRAAAGREVRYWSSRRASARVLPSPVDISEVRFGTTVTIVRDDGREQTLRIVGEDEADPAKGSISHASPLARSMFGKGVGDVVKAGHDDAEITFIR
jgi:hypothetical protein